MSRRGLITMTEDEITTFLRQSRTMILTSNGKDGYPHPMPMWYAVDDEGAVVMTTFRKSQKILNLKRDPKVSLLVEAGEEYAELRSVLIYADAEIIDDQAHTQDTLYRVTLHRGDTTPEQRDDVIAGVAKTAEKRVTIRMVPKQVVSWDHRKLGGRY